jgi:ribosomal protein S18 acetylase RimI-like enzyme
LPAHPGIRLDRILPEQDGRIADALDLLCDGLGRGAYHQADLTALAGAEWSLVLGATLEVDPMPLVGVAVAELLSPSNMSYYHRFGEDAVDLIGRHTVGNLSALAVRPHLRGQGIGQCMTAEVMRWLRRRDCDLLVATSWLSGGPNPSRPLFEKLGFHFIAEAPDVYLQESLERGLVCPFCNGHCHCRGALYSFDL